MGLFPNIFCFELSDPHILMIGLSSIIIISYLFNILSSKTNIPSVVMLIGLGIIIQKAAKGFGYDLPDLQTPLVFLGTVGVILIVLEAALDLELSKEKWPTIWKSLVAALLGLLVSTFIIAMFFKLVMSLDTLTSYFYAIPLSILSSAIIIPSVGGLIPSQKEFMVYESTFSDILGIMLFYFMKDYADATGAMEVATGITGNILITVILSVVASFGLILLIQRITSQLKLFLLIAVLLLLYAIGKKLGYSSLVLILFFGLMLNNTKLFFRGFLARYADNKILKNVLHDFHMITLESAFVLRTFFFVMFGVKIVLASLVSLSVVMYSLIVAIILYLVRLLFLAIFQKEDIFPLLYIAPRGLITIILFFAIPVEYTSVAFDSGILLFVILTTSFIMTISLIQNGFKIKPAAPEYEEGFYKIYD
ncbi:MAG: cation:proton antiporter [Flavobacteriales bacterium]